MQPNSTERRSLSDRVRETPSQTQRCTIRLQNQGALATGSGNAITNSKVYHSLGSRFGSASHATWTRSSVVAWFLFQCAVAFLHSVVTCARYTNRIQSARRSDTTLLRQPLSTLTSGETSERIPFVRRFNWLRFALK